MSPAPAVAPRAASGRRRWSGSRRGPGAPPARDLEARDTRGEPQQPCGVATHHVAEVVHPEVESTQPDGPDQQGGTQHHRDLCAPAVDPENTKHVGEHAIANQRAHRVAARKAPAVVMEERAGIGWPRALDHELEHLIEQAAAGEGSEPAAEQDPLTPGREEEAHAERQDAQRHRRAEEADRIEDGVPSRSGTPMHPVEERHVELGERVMVDDVFRDPTKQPQPRNADDEPDGEVEPEVLPARKPSGDERPGARIAYLELLEPRCREDPLPDELGTLDQPGAVPRKPAPPEREPHDQSNEQDAG